MGRLYENKERARKLRTCNLSNSANDITPSHLAYAEGEIVLFWLKALFIDKGMERGEAYEWGKHVFDNDYSLKMYGSCPNRDFLTKVVVLAEEYITERVAEHWYKGAYLRDVEKEIDKLPMADLSIY